MTGPLKNARHERFAQELAKGSTADAAYAAAGFKPSRAHASRLAAKGNIRARVSEIAIVAVEEIKIDAAWVLTKAAILHDKAMEAKNYSAARGALDLIGKHVEVQAFRENIHHGGSVELRQLTDEQLEAKIAALTGGQYVPRLTAH